MELSYRAHRSASAIRLAIGLAATAAILASCSGSADGNTSGDELSSTERAELVTAAREATADELYYEVEEVDPSEVTVVDDCAVVVVETPGVAKRSTGSAVMRRDGDGWTMVDMVTGDVTLRIDPDSETCWR